MNNIVAIFDKEILNFAKDYNLPPAKRRAILREYLQSKILSVIYEEKISKNLFFVGGTSLRLLKRLDRFSEDLDFDAVDISAKSIDLLVKKVRNRFTKENINISLYHNETINRHYYELRFPDILYDLRISQNIDEKLTIKLDFETWWRGQTREVVFFNRYGYLSNIVTKTLNQILVEKIAAYLGRKETQPRDIYDIVWLGSCGAKPDLTFARKNKIPSDFIHLVQKKYHKELNRMAGFKKRLSPFLLEEKNSHKIDFFPDILAGFK